MRQNRKPKGVTHVTSDHQQMVMATRWIPLPCDISDGVETASYAMELKHKGKLLLSFLLHVIDIINKPGDALSG